jgi:serine/threonine protein kinase
VGDRFGPYTVYECLGAGGMATVHRATIAIGAGVIREVALKRLLPQLADDKQFNEDFIREAKLAAQLDHPNIVHILELGKTAGTYFIAMELVRGQTLIQLMKKAYATKIQPPIGVVVTLISELCEALHYASRGRGVYGQPLNIVHRDLTPSNLIVTDEGRVKIIDFGVAKALSGKFMTNTGMVKGKLGYMSIEALSGSASLDARTDLFSLGVVAWELIAGRRLFRGVNEYEVITKIRQGDVSPPSEHNADCPPELDDIVLKALARDRENRWASASDIRVALDGLRRHYGDRAAEVAAWKHALIPVVRAVPRQAPDDEETAFQLSARDLTIDPPLAEGSGKSNPEQVRPTRPIRVSAALPTTYPTQTLVVSERPTVNGRPVVTTDDEPTSVDATMGELPLRDD